MEQVMEKVKKTKILALIGAIGLAISIFLPYVKVSIWGLSESVSLLDYWEGKVILLLVVLDALFLFKDSLKKYIPQLSNTPVGKWLETANLKFSLIPTGLSAVLAFIRYSNLSDEMGSYLKFSIGFFVIWASIACLVAFVFLYQGNGENAAQTPNSTQPTQPVAPAAVTPVTPQETVTQSAPVTPQVQPEVSSAPSEIPATKFCKYCGTKIDATATQCPSCGSQL